jgi:hypothetical protein
MSIPAIADKPTWDLTWEELLQRIETCFLADEQRLAKNKEYFQRFQGSMEEQQRERNLQKIDNDRLRLNLLEELLARIQTLDVQVLQKGMEMAKRHLIAAHKPFPEHFQFIITISENPKSLLIQFNPLFKGIKP